MTKVTKKQETRKRIVSAASQGFRSHGYAGIGVDAIAKEAGVTSGALYAHMGSKDGAFEAALLNTPVERADEPVEILRTLHSFDPCLACSTHIMSEDGEELANVKVR